VTADRGADPTPLQIIEGTVLERAKEIRLDLDGDAAKARLRELIEDEVARWSADYRRGLRSHDLADPELVIERGFRNLAGYGPLESLLDDDDVWEVMINAPDAIFVKRHTGQSGYHDEVFHDDEHVIRTLTKVLDDAAAAHRKLDSTEGLQDAQLDDGARLHIVHGDVSRGGHIMVNIRKFTGVAFRELDQLVDRDMLTVEAAAFLRACARAKLTVVFAGAPGSGKTTIMSCTAAELDPSLRVVVAEEVFEADVPLPNVASMQTRAARPDRPAVDLRRLVAGFLRMAPDVAIVGEVRDREALPLLLTLSSGVKGFTTIHAGSARQALSRLRFICQLSDTSSEIPMAALNSLVSESVDVVVHCARESGGPRVTEIIAVEDQAAGFESTQFTVTDLFARPRAGTALEWTGQFPQRAARALQAAGYDLRDLLGVPEQTTRRPAPDPPVPRPIHEGSGAFQVALDAKVHELRNRRSQVRP
jgi:pilus assembly protein CpaF